MEYQLRRYRIAKGKLEEFTEAWKAGVVPLREKFGFRLHGAWSVEESSEFIWVISYDGPEGFAAADEAYYESDERRGLTPNPAVHIVAGEQDWVEPVL